jgi:tetratricopeptide (TPR) repeat protein
MDSAWAARRASFDLPAGQRRTVMESTRSDLELAAALLRDTDDAVAYANALHLLAHVELGLGNEERAEALWREAVSILRGCDDPLQLAHKVRHLGDLEMGRARIRLAAAHYAEALDLYRTHGGADELGLANAVRRSALVKAELGEAVEARELWLEARDRYGRLGIDEGVVEADERLSGLR